MNRDDVHPAVASRSTSANVLMIIVQSLAIALYSNMLYTSNMKKTMITIRLDAKLKAAAQKAAKEDARTLTSLIVKLLRDYLEGSKRSTRRS
jgi:hypothetical protein